MPRGAESKSTLLLRPRHLEHRPRIRTVSRLEVYAGQAVTTTLPPSYHLHRVTVLIGLSQTAASQMNIWYLCGAALRRSRGAGLPECENQLKRSARFRFSIARSVASALCVTDCSALPVVITCGRGIGCRLTGKARRGRVECRSEWTNGAGAPLPTVDARVPQRRATKTGRSTKDGGVATRPLGLSRER
jgi:hypothetical protein